MHPRKDLLPLREIVFHVTNNGYFSSDLEPDPRLPDWALGVVAAVELDKSEFEEVLEVLEEVDEDV